MAVIKTALLIAVAVIVQEVAPSDDIMRNTGSKLSCMLVEEQVPLCADLGYINTTFPNLRGHTTPGEANEELAHFLALIYTGCSNAIVHLLCSIYAPVCLEDFPNLMYPPCKHLCEYVQHGCAETLQQVFRYNWPPGPHLDCRKYKTFEENQLCFGPRDPSILKIPTIIKYPDPPRNFTAVPLSPSTVKFAWEPPRGSMNEIFILTCEPMPYQFPRSTSDTMLKAGHFIPDTDYICTMFTAHTANIENSTTTVHFKTPHSGPPRKLAAKHQSPHSVKMSWNHPDSELPKSQRANYLYVLSCHSQVSDMEVSAKGEVIILNDLQASTEYTCLVSLAPSLTENETAAIKFTTLDPLGIHFLNDTPNIFHDTVRVEFQTTRPVEEITCRISGHSDKQDCSNHRAIFHNIPPGTHNLRIVAGNNKKDKIVVKIKIHVSGTDTSFCAANLINDRVAHMSNSVMVYFKGTNSGNRFRCSLNKQASFECYSPLFLRSLENGKHQVKITPQCDQPTTLTAQFIITQRAS